MRLRNFKYILLFFILFYIYYFFGVGEYLHSKSFDRDFDYPLNIELRPVVETLLSGKKPNVSPINYYPYRYLTNSGKCKTLEKLDLMIVVKSAMNNFNHRMAIRQTYGQENLLPGRIIKTLFFLGIDETKRGELQRKIEDEIVAFKDIIQSDFNDNYFNNTVKTMMSFRWVYEHCSTADYYLFTDDDMYISVSNLLNYVHDLTSGFNEDLTKIRSNGKHFKLSSTVSTASMTERDGYVFGGYLFKSAPHRYRSSKWRVSIDEYPWNKWPPYVTAGAYVVSNKAMKVLYTGSLFVKHFRFDDIYLGIVAKKLGLQLVHCSQFYFYKKRYDKDGYRSVIASHGYGDHEELIKVWNEQNKRY